MAACCLGRRSLAPRRGRVLASLRLSERLHQAVKTPADLLESGIELGQEPGVGIGRLRLRLDHDHIVADKGRE